MIFGRLTGRYATVSNYPGTTVGLTSGRALVGTEFCELVDTPGVNAVEGALSEDEDVTRRLLAGGEGDVVVQVADARNLRRALMLTAQIAAFQLPMVLVLNLCDEARRRGIAVDARQLGAELGIPVVETVATEGQGLTELRAALGDAACVHLPPHAVRDQALWAHETATRLRQVRPASIGQFQEWLARAVRQPATGLPILAAVLYATYLFVGVFGAKVLVDLIEHRVFEGYINPAATALATRFIPYAIVRDLLVGPYGLVTMGLTYAIAIVLPVVATFFLIFGWLEDSGYIPRLAIFSDRVFRAMGLNGKAVLPMVLGLGCDTMATMTTRILATPKERLIAVLLLALGIPCSAQLATILGILGGISFAALVTLFGVVLTQMFLVGFLAGRILPGDRSDFILELPPIRVPQLRNLLTKTLLRVRWYLAEAVPLFLIGTARSFCTGPHRPAGLGRGGRPAGGHRVAGSAGGHRPGVCDGLPPPRLWCGGPLPAGPRGTVERDAVGGSPDGHDPVRAVRGEFPDDHPRTGAEGGRGDPGVRDDRRGVHRGWPPLCVPGLRRPVLRVPVVWRRSGSETSGRWPACCATTRPGRSD